MKDAVREVWAAFNRPLEGHVNWMYLDIKGYVTTGMGNKIDSPAEACRLAWTVGRDGELATDAEITAAWNTVKARMDLAPRGGGIFRDITSLWLGDEAVDALVAEKLDQMETVLRGRAPFTDFDTWPADAQLGLLSMAWAMGPMFRFPKFQAAVAAREWVVAAEECRFQPNVGTIVTRNDRNQQLFRNAAEIEDAGDDPEILRFVVG